MSASFSPVRLLRLVFRTPYSLVGCSDFSSTSISVLSSILGLPFLSFVFLPCYLSSGVSASIRQCFFLSIRHLFYRTVCHYMRLSLIFFLPFRLVRSFFGALLPSLRFVCLGRIFLLVFLSFNSFHLRFFPLRVAIVFPLLLLPHFW